MLSKVLAGVVLATALSATTSAAQSIAQLGGPANLPPPGFAGQQFADSKGCIYMRAGFGNSVNWVPRVNRNHQPICGLPPTFGARVATVQPEPAPGPVPTPPPSPAPKPTVLATAPVAPAAPAAPARRVAVAKPTPAPGPTVVARPAQSAQSAPAPQAPARVRVPVAKPSPAPGPTVFASAQPTAPAAPAAPRRGSGFGFLFAAPQPHPAPAAQIVAAPVMPAVRAPVASSPITVARNAIPKPPKGYKLAWTDDRLNPQRGQGTAQGQAAQDQVWTREVPAVLVAVAPRTTAAPALRTTVSTMSAPQVPAARAAAYVQVGTFGQPANASAAAARLTALGLPVATARSGKSLQIVYAGPFSTAAAAQAALAKLRGAGFGDAVLK